MAAAMKIEHPTQNEYRPDDGGARLRRILIVDDDIFVAMTLQEGLERLPNCEVIAVTEPQRALELFGQAPFDLLITDYQMRGMNGLALAAHAHRLHPQMTTIIITAYGERVLREETDGLPIHRVLDKPVKLAEIRSIALQALEKHLAPPRRILILEDNDDLRRLYSRVLAKSAYKIYPAATLEEARALLSQGHFDVFLCDIHIGQERGTDLLREQLETLVRQGTQVVVVSGEAQYRPFCEEMGVEFYLEKPVAVNELLTLIRRLTAADGM
jgi:two-component system OmpR family response regulator